jgi:hypothetical protein
LQLHLTQQLSAQEAQPLHQATQVHLTPQPQQQEVVVAETAHQVAQVVALDLFGLAVLALRTPEEQELQDKEIMAEQLLHQLENLQQTQVVVAVLVRLDLMEAEALVLLAVLARIPIHLGHQSQERVLVQDMQQVAVAVDRLVQVQEALAEVEVAELMLLAALRQ